MRTVIGEYVSFVAAERAVRSLEWQISIQGVVIADQRQRRWRRRNLRRNRSLDTAESANFVVSMSGTPDSIEQARTLLDQPTDDDRDTQTFIRPPTDA